MDLTPRILERTQLMDLVCRRTHLFQWPENIWVPLDDFSPDGIKHNFSVHEPEAKPAFNNALDKIKS